MSLFGDRRLHLLLVALAMVGIGCTSDSGVTDEPLGDVPAGFIGTPAFDGVEPRVGSTDAPFRPGRQYYFRDANGELELSLFQDTGELEPLAADRTFDGRDFAFTDRRDNPNEISSATLDLDDGTRIFVSSLTLNAEQLVAIALAVEISDDGDVSDIDGFTLAGSFDQPLLRDGYATTYELADGASLSMSVTTMLKDELLSWEFGATEAVIVLDDTEAFITRPGSRSLTLGFQYPGSDYFVRIDEFSTQTEQFAFIFGYDEILDIVESIELREPTPVELARD